MREFNRTQRLNKQIKRLLAELIQQEMQDPRLSMVTVSAVEVSRDFDNARVYVTALGDEQNMEIVLERLERAAGFLRHQLGKGLVMRKVPALHFVCDRSVERGDQLSSLIEQAVAEDRRHRNNSS